MNTNTPIPSYGQIKMLLIELHILGEVIYDCHGNPFNEKEEKKLRAGSHAERELIRIGYLDQDGRYINSSNPVLRSAARWYEKTFIN